MSGLLNIFTVLLYLRYKYYRQPLIGAPLRAPRQASCVLQSTSIKFVRVNTTVKVANLDLSITVRA